MKEEPFVSVSDVLTVLTVLFVFLCIGYAITTRDEWIPWLQRQAVRRRWRKHHDR